jgi:tetratricopeptide (TPR) repeat protein
MIFGAHGFLDEALLCLETATRFDAREPCWPYLAGVLLTNTQPEEAIKRVQLAITRAEGPAEAGRLRLADLCLMTGNVLDARPLYERLADSGTMAGRANLGLGRIAWLARDLEQSVAYLEKAKPYPESAKASRTLLAEVRHRQGDQVGARKLAAEAEAMPEDVDVVDPWAHRMERVQAGEQARLRRADLLLAQDKVDSALSILTQLSKDYPQSAAVWQALGKGFVQGRRMREAETAFRHAHEIDPSRAEVVFYLGVAAYEQGEKARAGTLFEQATKLRADHALAWFNLGQCRRELDNVEGAIEAFRKAVGYKPNHGKGHVVLAQLLIARKEPQAAREHLARGSQLLPEDKEVMALQRQLREGK